MRRLGPRSSVCALIPHFACEAWLGQAIESLLGQTRPPEAIVVIDDASPGPPVDIVSAYPEVTLLAAPDNGGPYRLVQAVMDRTAFDAYLFQDADDWSAPGRLEALLDRAWETGAELVGCHEVRVLVDHGDVVPVRYPLDAGAVLAERPTAFPLLHPTSLVGRDLVERIGGFASGMRFSGDAEFLRRAAHVTRVVNADHFGYFRRKRAGSLTTDPATALQSPARLRVQVELAARARHNADLASRGDRPDLRPWQVADRPDLRHLAGPRPGQAAARAGRRRWRRRASGRSAGGGPVFVIGPPRSGQMLLAWALGQHPRLHALVDGRWIARAAADVEGRAGDDAAPTPVDFRRALATSLDALATEGAGVARWVAADPELTRAAHALAALFPTARFLHVTRPPDAVVASLVEAPTEGGRYHSTESAWGAWVADTEDALTLEAALGPGRVLRVGFSSLATDREGSVRRCLAFLGEEFDAACVRPLTGLEPDGVDLRDTALRAAPAVAARAAALQRRLAQPPPEEANGDAATELAQRFRRRRTSAGSNGALVERLHALVGQSVPEAVTVAVVSRGDPRLVDLDGRTGWHLPQVAGGEYAGHHPADSSSAVEALEGLRRAGATYLVFPSSTAWWLTFYEGLRRHLADMATLVAFQEDVGAVYRLAPEPAAPAGGEPRPPRFVAVPAREQVRAP